MLAPNFTPNPSWSADVLDELRVLWEAGKSASECAYHLNTKYRTKFSRNAIIGRLRRLGLLGQRKRGPEALHLRKALARKTKTHNITRVLAVANKHDPGLSPKLLQPADDVAPVGQRKTILELDNTHCRWPYGHPGDADFFYCGAPDVDVIEHRPYCAFHARISRGKPRSAASEAA